MEPRTASLIAGVFWLAVGGWWILGAASGQDLQQDRTLYAVLAALTALLGTWLVIRPGQPGPLTASIAWGVINLLGYVAIASSLQVVEALIAVGSLVATVLSFAGRQAAVARPSD